MKSHFDKKSVECNFQPGDSLLVFLPVQGSAMQAKFGGPYEIERKRSETDYICVYSRSQKENTSLACEYAKALLQK